MRSTILFLTLLVFISASTNMIDSYDTVLLELATDPRSEAIFATMAVQLRQGAGFDRVLALLNELVDDGRKQLHTANKLWRSTEARCEVSTMKFQERQDFYENRATHIAESAANAQVNRNYADSTEKFLGSSAKWFSGFLTQEETRHKTDGAMIGKALDAASNALDRVDGAIKVVQEWIKKPKSGKKQSFIQESLDSVAASYLEVKSYKIVVPSSFVELAASDSKVKQRLLEWLAALRITFLEAKSHFTGKQAKLMASWKSIETQIKNLVGVYNGDVKFAHSQIAVHELSVKNLTSTAELFRKLVAENASLVKANVAYCKVERENFTKTKALVEGQLKLFRDVRTYFRNNYASISKFVKKKYTSS